MRDGRAAHALAGEPSLRVIADARRSEPASRHLGWRFVEVDRVRGPVLAVTENSRRADSCVCRLPELLIVTIDLPRSLP